MLGLKLNHVSKRGYSCQLIESIIILPLENTAVALTRYIKQCRCIITSTSQDYIRQEFCQSLNAFIQANGFKTIKPSSTLS